MDIRKYIKILIGKWWLILLTVIITLGAVSWFTFSQQPIYQTSVTYIVRPNVADEDARELLSGLDVLSRREEIARTYAEVAISRLVRNKAADMLELTAEEKASMEVSSRLLAGTNVLEISVTGPDPYMIRDYADTVGEETVSYVKELYETYQLAHLDSADASFTPIGPGRVFNLSLGLFVGLVLGIGLAFFAHYLQVRQQEPLDGKASSSIGDEPIEDSQLAEPMS